MSLWLAGGCAFPIFNSNAEPRDSRAFAYAPRQHETGRATRNEEQPSRASSSSSARTRRNSSVQPRSRRAGSVLSPQYFGEPPDPREGEAPPRIADADCFDQLRRWRVAFEVVAPEDAPGIAMPLILRGPLGGVTFAPADKKETHATLDCRLAIALHAWAQDLRDHGVVRVEHYSMYRPGARVGGGDRVSGHAHGLAIDAARFMLADGSLYEVLSDWEGRERGAAPCPMRPDESFGSRLLRSITCQAVQEQLFQVIITPHHDRAHSNHVHFERKPEVDWTYVR